MLVFFDIETSGINHDYPHYSYRKYDVTQIAGAAFGHDGKIWGTFERKVRFDEETAQKEALEMTSYDPLVWAEQAITAPEAIFEWGQFLKRHTSIEKISKKGNPYRVARIAGHNIINFDLPFFNGWKKKYNENAWVPFDYNVIDTRSMATVLQHEGLHNPLSLKLSDLAAYYNVEIDAHDALGDVIANGRVYLEMIDKLQDWNGGRS